jgi:hypothetical protein
MRLTFAVFFLFFCSMAFSAECRVIEYEVLASDGGGKSAPLPREPNLAVQEITYTVSTTSAAFNPLTHFVRIRCDALAYYKFSTVTQDISAAATDASIPADVTVDFGIPAGQSYKVEFYNGTS